MPPESAYAPSFGLGYNPSDDAGITGGGSPSQGDDGGGGGGGGGGDDGGGSPSGDGGGDGFMAKGGKVTRNLGIAALLQGGYPRRNGQINGPGTGKSDSIPAMLSDGEFVMTAKAVRGAGKGSRRAGAKKMYALMHQLEKNSERG